MAASSKCDASPRNGGPVVGSLEARADQDIFRPMHEYAHFVRIVLRSWQDRTI
jgi:hypothetical protein